MSISHPGMRATLLVLLGSLATLGFAPFELPTFTLISIAGAYLILLKTPQAAIAGWCYGLGFFSAGVGWIYVSIHEHGNTPAPGAAALTLLFAAALATLFALQFSLCKRFFKEHSACAFVALWVLFEWLRSWLFTGFPWLYIGTAWLDAPIAALAPLGGVWLVSLAAVSIAILAAQAIAQRSPVAAGAALGLFIMPLLLPNQWTEPKGDSISVALIQPNIDQSLKWQPTYFEQHLNTLSRLSDEATEADWIVWPETAIPRLINQAWPLIDPIRERLEERGQTLVSGFPYGRYDADTGKERYFNALGVLTGKPEIYLKQRLVPFGEYLPFEAQLRGLIEFFSLPMSDFSLPSETQLGLQIEGIEVATGICYEIAFPELMRQQSRNSGIILTLSNDTWFTGSHGPAQHLQIARMRALENGRWVIRGTNNGHTAFIDPQGKLVSQASIEEASYLVSDVIPYQGQTPFQQTGSWPTLLLSVLLLVPGVLQRRRNATLEET